jgi:hypothetical protein
MVSHLLFYQLVLIALAWLFFLLLYAWPRARARRPHPAAASTQTPPNRLSAWPRNHPVPCVSRTSRIPKCPLPRDPTRCRRRIDAPA